MNFFQALDASSILVFSNPVSSLSRNFSILASSSTCHNLDYIPEDESYKFFDDASMIEVINLISTGLTSFNIKSSVPSDLSPQNLFLPTENTMTQDRLDKINNWTVQN